MCDRNCNNGQCVFNTDYTSKSCVCDDGYTGDNCETKPRKITRIANNPDFNIKMKFYNNRKQLFSVKLHLIFAESFGFKS